MTSRGHIQHRSAQRWTRVWPLMLSMVIGCATFRGGRLDDPSPWPPVPRRAAQPTLLVDLSGLADTSGVSQYGPAAFHRGLADCIETLRRSNLFSRVDTGSGDPDLYLTGDARYEQVGSIGGALVAGFTLFIAPAHFMTERWHIEARIMSARSQRSEDVAFEETSSTWVGLVLLPITPFAAGSQGAQVKESMCRSLALAIRDASEEFQATK